MICWPVLFVLAGHMGESSGYPALPGMLILVATLSKESSTTGYRIHRTPTIVQIDREVLEKFQAGRSMPD
jgi:hypothetical protein